MLRKSGTWLHSGRTHGFPSACIFHARSDVLLAQRCRSERAKTMLVSLPAGAKDTSQAGVPSTMIPFASPRTMESNVTRPCRGGRRGDLRAIRWMRLRLANRGCRLADLYAVICSMRLHLCTPCSRFSSCGLDCGTTWPKNNKLLTRQEKQLWQGGPWGRPASCDHKGRPYEIIQAHRIRRTR